MSRLTLLLVLVCLWSNAALAQRSKKPQIPKVCGDPTVRCVTDFNFEPHQLPLMVKDSGGPIQESEFFYAVILKTQRVKDNACAETFFTEKERLAVQELFPHNKAFTDRCPEPGEIYYTGYDYRVRLLGIYAGRTAKDAAAILKAVKAKYPSAAVRRMRAGFNGT